MYKHQIQFQGQFANFPLFDLVPNPVRKINDQVTNDENKNINAVATLITL